jgi:hypothetical protein
VLDRIENNVFPIVIRNIKIEQSNHAFVDMILQRIENREIIRGMVLIVFRDVNSAMEQEPINSKSAKTMAQAVKKIWN